MKRVSTPDTESTARDPVASHASSVSLEDFAGDIQVAHGRPPRWSTWIPYLAVVGALAYYLHVGVTDPVNLVFASLFVVWFAYTPLAKKRGWFFIPM